MPVNLLEHMQKGHGRERHVCLTVDLVPGFHYLAGGYLRLGNISLCLGKE